MGTTLTGTASLLFALINPSSSYWAFGFPAAVVGVFGADFVFASGTLFVAKVALPHEQSVGGALFQTMTQVYENHFGRVTDDLLRLLLEDRDCIRANDHYDRIR